MDIFSMYSQRDYRRQILSELDPTIKWEIAGTILVLTFVIIVIAAVTCCCNRWRSEDTQPLRARLSAEYGNLQYGSCLTDDSMTAEDASGDEGPHHKVLIDPPTIV